MGALKRISRAMDYLTGRWWFYVLLFLVAFILLPPYASKGYSMEETGAVIFEALANPVIYRLVDAVWPSALLHLLAVVIIAAIAVWGGRAVRAFDVYVFGTYLMIAVGQGTAITERYGLVVITGNVLLMLLVASSWAWECLVVRNKFRKKFFRPERLWLAPFTIWAFWSPIHPFSLDPRYLLVGYFGVTYCFTTPVILSLMALYYPDVNKPAMRLTAFLGLIFGLMNVLSPLFMWSVEVFWVGTVLHIPLLVTCAYVLALSVTRERKEQKSPLATI